MTKGIHKPKTWEELIKLVESGDMEILIQEDLDNGTTRLLICDHRRRYIDGEIYEIIV